MQNKKKKKKVDCKVDTDLKALFTETREDETFL